MKGKVRKAIRIPSIHGNGKSKAKLSFRLKFLTYIRN